MFEQLNMTNAGALLASQAAVGDQIQFTKIKMGDGNQPEDYRSLTDLVHPMMSMPIARQRIVDVNTVALGANLYPADITENFYWKEVGLYAKNVTKGGAEVLFSYGYSVAPSFISHGGTITEKYIDIDLQLSDASNVIINLDYSNLFPTKYEMTEALDNLDKKIQEDIRSSKNTWLIDEMGTGVGDTTTKTAALMANLNTVSTGEQAVPNVGDLVITGDGHIGYISSASNGTYEITTMGDGVERHKTYPNGDWELYLSESAGGGHYTWIKATGTLIKEIKGTGAIVYERSAVNEGGDNFQLTGGTHVGARLITAWSGGNAGSGELKYYYTTGNGDSDITDADEIATKGYVHTYVADNSGIFVGTAKTKADLLANKITGTPAGHAISKNDWVIVQDDESQNGHQTSYIVSKTDPIVWTFATIRDLDIPGVDDSTIYLNSDGKYAVKPGAPVQLGNGTITDANIGNRTLATPTESTTVGLTGDLTTILQGFANNITYLMNKTVKAPSQKIHMYVQDTAVTPEPGINKVRIPVTENQ